MSKNKNEWDLVIEPRGSLFRLNLNEVWKYRDLLEMYMKRDIVTFYKQTILIWVGFLYNRFTTIVFMFVFGGFHANSN